MVIQNNIIQFFVNFYAGRLNYILSEETKNAIKKEFCGQFFNVEKIQTLVKNDIHNYLEKLHFQKVAAHRKRQLQEKVKEHFVCIVPEYGLKLRDDSTVFFHNYEYLPPKGVVNEVILYERFKTEYAGNVFEDISKEYSINAK